MALVITTYIFITYIWRQVLSKSAWMFSPLGNQVMSKIVCKFCNFQKLLQKLHVNIYDFLLPIFKILQRFLLHVDIPHVTYLPWIFSPIVFKHLFIAPTASSLHVELFMDSSPVQRPTTSKTSCRIFYISSDQNNTPRMISHSLMKCSWMPFLVLHRLD